MINKTNFLMILLLLLSTILFAQNSNRAPIKFAVLAGPNFYNLNGKDFSGDQLDNNLQIGFHAGVNAQIRLASEFYFEPGVIFTTKGTVNKLESVTRKTTLSYVEVPLNFVYKAALGTGHIMIGLGPYVAYGVQGKVNTEGGAGQIDTPIDFKNTVELTDPITTEYYKPFDAGANIYIGYELPMGVFLQLNAQFGTLEINPDDKRFPDGETSVKNTGFGLSLGYRF